MTYPTKPPFSYYGGKQRLASKICNLIPPHTVYVEPFCGSAAVFFMKGLPQNTNSNHYREVLNDINGLIVNFFRVMQNKKQREELIDRLEWTLYSQEEYKKAKDLCRKNTDDPVLMAWAWFVNISCSFSNKFNSGFGTGVYGRELASTFYSKIESLKLFRDRFKCCTIMNEPALRVIERFDSQQTVFYVDPPYPETNQGHYSGFTQQDFEQLIDRLKSCKGAVLLSCYNNPAVPDDWVKHEFEATMSAANGKNRDSENIKRIECVWYKPASEKMRKELLSVSLHNKRTFNQNPKETMAIPFDDV